jgi:hypothetical protein
MKDAFAAGFQQPQGGLFGSYFRVFDFIFLVRNYLWRNKFR